MAHIPKLNWINNEWVDSKIYKDSINPATGEIIGSYANGGEKEAADGIAAALAAFKNSDWKDNRLLRSQVLNEIADAFEANKNTLIELLKLENGKIHGEAEPEILFAPAKFRYYAALVLTDSGRAIQTKPGSFSMVLHEPVGVAGIIVPWNSPVILMIRSLAPALAAGCTTVIKMPGQTALVNAAINDIFASVKSLPKGVINQFTESGRPGGALLVSSSDVPSISFTGSSATGKVFMKNGADSLKRFGFELGGKTPMLVFDDANLEVAVPVLSKAITMFAGQFCMTGSRILVQRGIAEKFSKALSAHLKKVKAGPAADPTSEMGPMIDKANVDRVDAMVNEAIAQGAKALVRGGKITEGPLAAGAFYRPALLQVADNKMKIVQEEVFGPVATLQIFDTPEEAVQLANDNPYGLSASVWSQHIDFPYKVAREIDAGTVWINNWAQINDETEEGGYKMSGVGRLNGLAAIHDFIQYKHIFHNAGTLQH